MFTVGQNSTDQDIALVNSLLFLWQYHIKIIAIVTNRVNAINNMVLSPNEVPAYACSTMIIIERPILIVLHNIITTNNKLIDERQCSPKLGWVPLAFPTHSILLIGLQWYYVHGNGLGSPTMIITHQIVCYRNASFHPTVSDKVYLLNSGWKNN